MSDQETIPKLLLQTWARKKRNFLTGQMDHSDLIHLFLKSKCIFKLKVTTPPSGQTNQMQKKMRTRSMRNLFKSHPKYVRNRSIADNKFKSTTMKKIKYINYIVIQSELLWNREMQQRVFFLRLRVEGIGWNKNQNEMKTSKESIVSSMLQRKEYQKLKTIF